MIEIYNEIVRDLLSTKPGEKNTPKGLPLHEKVTLFPQIILN
jgi:hypothetical protein